MKNACKAISMIYADPLRCLSLNCFSYKFQQKNVMRCGENVPEKVLGSDTKPTAYVISHVFVLCSRRPDFVNLAKFYEITRAHGRPTDYATIPLYTSTVVLNFLKEPVHSFVCPQRPDCMLHLLQASK
jgi:hypothetical protein